jgi:hypothetical protein
MVNTYSLYNPITLITGIIGITTITGITEPCDCGICGIGVIAVTGVYAREAQGSRARTPGLQEIRTATHIATRARARAKRPAPFAKILQGRHR